MEQAIISGVAHDRSEAKVTIVGVPDVPGKAAEIFNTMAATEINIDMIVQNISTREPGKTDISFTLPMDDGAKALEALDAVKTSIGFDQVRYDDQIGKLSVVGRRDALSPRRDRHPVRGPEQRPGQHRHDLHLGDPHQRRHTSRHPRRRRPCRTCRVRTRQ